LTTGALAVDVASSAYRGISGGSSTASLYFDAGVAQPAAGHASVNGNVKALGSNGYLTGDSRATLTLYRTGTLTGRRCRQQGDWGDKWPG
jgi:hypothetical protein